MTITELLQEVQRRRARDPETYLCDLFPQQRAFVEDASPAKVALCSRRAGKSIGSISHMMLAAMRHPGVPMAFLALTIASAKRIIWEPLHTFNDRYGVGIKFNESDLTATFPGRTTLYVTGADNSKLIDRFRGAPYSTVVIDESASFRTSVLETLVEDVLEPALMDVQGSLVVMGTPGAVPAGFFHDISTGAKSGWSRHHWTLLDNPYLPHARTFVDNLLIKKGWTSEHPTFRREWCGEWVRDLGALVYPYDEQRNRVDRLPASLRADGWHYILAIDFGVTNATAMVVLAWHEDDPAVYVVESEERTGVIPSEAATWAKRLMARYDFDRIVGDVGGLGKAFAEEMRRRYAIPVHAAQKSDKRGAQELMAGDMKSGLIRVVAVGNADLVEEWGILQWNEDRSKEDERFKNHLSDAALYGWREAKGWAAEAPAPKRTAPRTEEERMARLLEEEREAEERAAMPLREDDFGFASSLDELTGMRW